MKNVLIKQNIGKQLCDSSWSLTFYICHLNVIIQCIIICFLDGFALLPAFSQFAVVEFLVGAQFFQLIR